MILKISVKEILNWCNRRQDRSFKIPKLLIHKAINHQNALIQIHSPRMEQ